jgi:predicted nucleotidyltransferase
MNLPVTNKQELISRMLLNETKIRSLGVRRLGIFGSFVRNEMSDDSDVDFFVDLEASGKTFKNFMYLADFLEEITGRSVELVTPQSLNEFTGKYILQELEYVPFAA